MKHKLLTYLARVFCVVVASSPSILFGVLADHLTGLGVGIGVTAVLALPTGYYINEIEQFFESDKPINPHE